MDNILLHLGRSNNDREREREREREIFIQIKDTQINLIKT
jgi:hypothetical protein